MHKCFVVRLLCLGGNAVQNLLTSQKKKKKQKNADKVTRKENPQLKSEARPSPSASSSSPERSVDRGARTITRLENKIYLID